MKDLKIHASLLLVVPTPNVVYLEIHRLVHVCLNLWEHRRTADPSVYPTLTALRTRHVSTRNAVTHVPALAAKTPSVKWSITWPPVIVWLDTPVTRTAYAASQSMSRVR